MTKLMEYFQTDWAEMSRNDWIGVVFTVLAAVAMVVVYVMVFRPRNKEFFEAQADSVLRDEDDYNNSGDIK